MKNLYDKKIKYLKLLNQISSELDDKILEKWGVHYSEIGDDKIIDSLDYGTSEMTFSEFEKRMDLLVNKL